MEKRSAAIIIREEKILLMHRLRGGLEYYAVPGGMIEEKETPETAAIREVKEETNLDVKLGKLFFEFEGIRGREYFFLAESILGKSKFGGPELERNCEENFYELAWIELAQLSKIKLYPSEIKKEIMEKLV